MKSSIYVQYFSQYKSKKEKFRQPWQKYFRNTHDKYAIQALNSQVANKSNSALLPLSFETETMLFFLVENIPSVFFF